MKSPQNVGLMLHWDQRRRVEQYSFAYQHNLGLEIVSFSWPGLWNDVTMKSDTILQYQKEIDGIKNVWSLHGPFADVLLHSEDDSIRVIAESRIVETLNIARQLGVPRVVFHSGINPIITDPAYFHHAIEQQAIFWSKVLKQHQNLTVCLENMWEPDPEFFVRLLKMVSCERLKVCLDIGHVNVYSRVPFSEWIERLGNSIAHIHLNDNQGDMDSHLSVGSGTIEWREFFQLTSKKLPEAAYILELDSLQKQQRSLQAMIEVMGTLDNN